MAHTRGRYYQVYLSINGCEKKHYKSISNEQIHDHLWLFSTSSQTLQEQLNNSHLLRAQVVAGQVGSLKIGSYGVSLICAKIVGFECYVSCFLTLSYYFVLAFRSWSLLLFSSMF